MQGTGKMTGLKILNRDVEIARRIGGASIRAIIVADGRPIGRPKVQHGPRFLSVLLADKNPSFCGLCGRPTYRLGGYCSRACEKDAA